MNYPVSDEFVSNESKEFKFKIGRRLASALSGFIAGALVASIVWIAVIYLVQPL